MVKMTQNAVGGYDFNQSCVYFFAEGLKLTVAGAWCVYHHKQGDSSYDIAAVDRNEVLQYAVPGFVFFAQNNLSFIALQCARTLHPAPSDPPGPVQRAPRSRAAVHTGGSGKRE